MAIQKDTQYIGTVDNLIYYKWMNLYCIRTVPSGMRQTEATKRAAINFGKVSSRSKILRNYFMRFIGAPRNKEMQKQLKKALLASIQFMESGAGEMANHPLNGFHFNEALSLEQSLGFKLNISEQAAGAFQVDIPAINPAKLIKFPPGTNRLQLEMQAVSFSFTHEETYSGTPVFLNIPYSDNNQPSVAVEVSTWYTEPCIVLLAVSLSYWQEDKRINNTGYNPTEIIAVSLA